MHIHIESARENTCNYYFWLPECESSCLDQRTHFVGSFLYLNMIQKSQLILCVRLLTLVVFHLWTPPYNNHFLSLSLTDSKCEYRNPEKKKKTILTVRIQEPPFWLVNAEKWTNLFFLKLRKAVPEYECYYLFFFYAFGVSHCLSYSGSAFLLPKPLFGIFLELRVWKLLIRIIITIHRSKSMRKISIYWKLWYVCLVNL